MLENLDRIHPIIFLSQKRPNIKIESDHQDKYDDI